jgi:1-acyl-sn-glycerol-3-phosphate acyltransferase
VPAPVPAGRDADDPFRPALLRLSQRVGERVLRALFEVTVEGAEHVPLTGPLLLAGNHVGSLDGPLLVVLAPRPVRALAKAEFFTRPGGRLLAAIGQIPVHRDKPDRAALRSALDVLGAGGAVAVFPEGECGPGTLDQVHPGVAWLALRTGAPVLPVVFSGTDRAVANGDWRPRLRSPVRVVLGAPFAVDVPDDPRSRRALAAAQEQVRAGLLRHLAAVGAAV